MSSRYYGVYQQPSYSRARPQKQARQYQASSPKQTKAKPQRRGITDSGRIPGPYTPTLGRKKPVGHWKAKKKSDATLKGGEFNHETVEEELNKYKKGVFYFDDANAAANAASNGHAASKQSRHKQYAQHQLLKTQDAPPKVYEEVDELPPPVPPDYEERTKSGHAGDDDDEKEPRVPKTSKPRSEEETKQKPSTRERSKKSSTTKSSKSRRKKTTRIQPMVTVSPSRGGGAAYGGMQVPHDYYYGYGGYDMHAAAMPSHAPPLPPYYGDARDDMYRPPALPSYGGKGKDYAGKYVPDGYAYLGPRGVEAYSQFPAAKGFVQDDGTWYPYQDILSNDPYATPKTKRTRKDADSANVDLTTPIADGERDKDMNLGRRVNKIQKQLEYYFSPQNMETDVFLRQSMDKEGWIDIMVILGFKRMQHLHATKELVVEAAFHSNVVEVDSKTQEKIRMTKYWKEYVNDVNGKKEKRRSKKSSSSSEQRKKEKEEERKLDEAELNKATYKQIASFIEHKMERRRKRHEERERRKKDQESKEKETSKDKKKDPQQDQDAEPEPEPEDEEEEDAKELIRKDQQQRDDSQGDPDHNDMVELD